MTLPAYRTMPAKAPDSLLAALGIEDVCNAEWNVETNILLLELPDEGVVTRLKPDIAALIRSHESINGVLVTARSQTQDFDYCSRYFWPWSGTNEDPVTGGTQTFLAGYWASRLEKVCMKTYQASLRGGAMEVEVCDGEVQVRAQAVVVFEGQTRLSHRALNHRSQ